MKYQEYCNFDSKKIMKSIAERFQSVSKTRASVDALRLGAFVVQLAKQYAEHDPDVIQWYVKWQKLFLRLGKKEHRHQRFVNKKDILDEINEKLAHVGYDFELKDIVLR